MRLTTSPPSSAKCHEIWEPKPPGTLWATPGLLRDSFTFTFLTMTFTYDRQRLQKGGAVEFNGKWNSVLAIKWLGCELEHSFPSSVQVHNWWTWHYLLGLGPPSVQTPVPHVDTLRPVIIHIWSMVWHQTCWCMHGPKLNYQLCHRTWPRGHIRVY